MPIGNWLRYKIDLKGRTESGQGYLYSGEDPLLTRSVTVKKIVGNLQSAEREAALMASYGQNHFLPQVFDFFVFGEDGYIVTDALPVEPVGDDPVQGKRRELSKAIRITQNVLRGLRHLHEKGILHACLEPRHVLLADDRSSTVKISGFSCAVRKRVQGYYKGPEPGGRWEYMAPEQFVPTEQYLAPRQLMGEVQLDDRADLYSAAALCYYLLTGQAPFSSSEAAYSETATFYGDVLRRHEQGQMGEWKGVPEDLKMILIKAMHPDRDQRPANAGEFLNLLRPYEK